MKDSARKIYYDHFCSRLSERYGIITTDRVYHEIIRQIKNTHKHTRVMRINRQRSIHRVYINNQRVFVVYRKSKSALITALPPSKYLELAYWKEKERAEFDATMRQVLKERAKAWERLA